MEMDKYRLVFDVIEHPEKYPPEKVEELLSDPEVAEIYRLLCLTASSVEYRADVKEIDVEEEWHRFSANHFSPRRNLFTMHRAASIAVIVVSSLVALALGVAMKISYPSGDSQSHDNDTAVSVIVTEASVIESGVSPDSMTVDKSPVLFDNEPIDSILAVIGEHYGVDVVFESDRSKSLRLYYRLDMTQPLESLVDELNTFEQINIRNNGNILIVE